MPEYSEGPKDPAAFTQRFDRFYTRFAPVYDLLVRALPVWKTWLCRALPHLKGPRILEVSFGTAYLMTQYAGRFESHGVDLNEKMVAIAHRNIDRVGLTADLRQGNVESLPCRDEHFDTVLCTMAFSGYPDAPLVHAARSPCEKAAIVGTRIVGPRGEPGGSSRIHRSPRRAALPPSRRRAVAARADFALNGPRRH
jgi:hypothetical protein